MRSPMPYDMTLASIYHMRVMTKRAYNLSAGPATLPLEVLEEVQSNLISYRGSGVGIMEMSHRSKAFEEIIQATEANLRELLSIGDNYSVLFTTGGATNQFSMIPLNLRAKNQTADFIITGSWAEKALEEAARFGEVHIAASSKDKKFSFIPTELNLSSNPAYVHFTSNNTIAGTQFSKEPEVGSNVLVCDASSDLLHKKIDINKYGLIYAGAQKNLGPAGVTVVIIRKDLLERVPQDLPIMLNYKTYSDNQSMYNTPPTLPIYVVGEVFKWLKKNGGLDEMYKTNKEKAQILYSFLDSSDFYQGLAEPASRSLMNVTFRISKSELEATFIDEAKKAGFSELKGHRSVGGLRASIYNAFPKEGVSALVEFMKEFQAKNA